MNDVDDCVEAGSDLISGPETNRPHTCQQCVRDITFFPRLPLQISRKKTLNKEIPSLSTTQVLTP